MNIKLDKFYILIDDTLFSVDLDSKELMIEIDNLKDGTYAVSDNGDAIAYSVSGDIYNTDTIRVLNMSNDSAYEIKAEDGDTLYMRCIRLALLMSTIIQ